MLVILGSSVPLSSLSEHVLLIMVSYTFLYSLSVPFSPPPLSELSIEIFEIIKEGNLP